MSTEKNRNTRPEAYPRPSETDQQLKNQPEFIDQQPNDFRDKSISDIPAVDPDVQQTNDPQKEQSKEEGEMPPDTRSFRDFD